MENAVNKVFPELTGLFGNTPKTIGFKVHATSCSMVNASGRKVTVCKVDAFTIVDMQERGFKVTFCKCVSMDQAKAVLTAAKEHGPTGQS